MPPAICDSEDEEVLVEDDRPSQRSQRSTVSGCIAHAEEVLATFPFEGAMDGANERSSLSTGELNRQIRDVQRGFFDSTGEKSATSVTMAAATSPAKEKVNRRHSTVTGSLPAATPSRSAERTKTLTTYGSSKRSRAVNPADDPAFAALRDEEAAQGRPHAFTFSGNLDEPNPSRGLPTGTLQDDFANHNPNVMFRDTGSTIAYNESSEQRMLEQALQSARNPASSAAGPAESEKNLSPPFPWSSDKPTQSPKSNQSKQSNCHDEVSQDHPDRAKKAGNGTAAVTPVGKQDMPHVTDKLNSQNSAANTDLDATVVQPSLGSAGIPPKSSPQVIVHTNGTPHETIALSTDKKASQGRKRKISVPAKEQSSEPLNSDDHLIGLPKERYQPKPSRRRMTQLPEEAIDYSIVPERAAKKRRKTLTDASLTETHADGEDMKSLTSKPKSTQKKTKSNLSQPQKAAPLVEPSAAEQPTPGTPGKAAAPTQGSPVRPVASPLSSPERTAPKQAKSSASPTKASMLSTKPSQSPTKMRPPTLPASSTKKKVARSHTTIFEDHSQSSSPSLRQQQEARRSALQGVGKRKAPANRPKRRIVQDDEDDEDELSKELDDEIIVPKKRGRPTKAEAQKKADSDQQSTRNGIEDDEEEDEPPRKRGRQPKSTSRVLDDSEVEDEITATQPAKKDRMRKSTQKVMEDSEPDIDAEVTEEAETVVQQPKKKRGRPSKAKPDVPPPSGPESVKNKTADEISNSDANEKTQEKEQHVLKAKDVNAQPKARESTPAPTIEKAAKEKPPPTPTSTSKPGPTNHSPIKKTNKALNHRVGLNKKSRIPPLLKMVRPVQRKEVERVTKVTSVAELERMAAAKLEE